MGNKISHLFLGVMVLILVTACSQVLITGRKQLLLFSQGEITSLSSQAYNQIMVESRLSSNTLYVQMVRNVGTNMIRAVERYVKENGYEAALEGITWGFDVIESSEVNAFCLPNGRIVFYEGIMKITDTPDLVAVVMGHEIAHALAKHGNERMSHDALIGTVGQAISAYIGTEDQKKQLAFQLAYGLGSQLGVSLPYSRKHEYEADRLGLIIMAMAGYNINVAPGFWEKMSRSNQSSPMEFFSTHPSDANRIKYITSVLPEAAQYAPAK